jgi:hypothetical protein
MTFGLWFLKSQKSQLTDITKGVVEQKQIAVDYVDWRV